MDVFDELKRRLARVIFAQPEVFTLDKLSATYLEAYGHSPDIEAVKAYLGQLVSAGYVRQQDSRYAVVMTPLEV